MNQIASLVIVMDDGTTLYIGKVEVRDRIRTTTQDELESIVKEKQRITEPSTY